MKASYSSRFNRIMNKIDRSIDRMEALLASELEKGEQAKLARELEEVKPGVLVSASVTLDTNVQYFFAKTSPALPVIIIKPSKKLPALKNTAAPSEEIPC